MASVEIYLGLGSNLGDRRLNLELALSLLAREIQLLAISSIYETEPWGVEEQPRYLNCVCRGYTALSPTAMLMLTQSVEKDLGRQATFRYGPRIIDVDILLYGRQTYRSAELEIPHPRLAERAFTLIPLAEVSPNLIHPVLQQTMSDLASRVGGREGVRLWSEAISLAALAG